MAEYVVKGAEPNETVLHSRTTNGYEAWHWLPVREEIVRCKDCKFQHETLDGIILCEFWTDSYDEDALPSVEPDGFCAWGERREDA